MSLARAPRSAEVLQFIVRLILRYEWTVMHVNYQRRGTPYNLHHLYLVLQQPFSCCMEPWVHVCELTSWAGPLQHMSPCVCLKPFEEMEGSVSTWGEKYTIC